MKIKYFSQLWYSEDETLWKYYLEQYKKRINKSNQIKFDRYLEKLEEEMLEKFSPEKWYDFLLNFYFKWKYTQVNRYISLTNHIKKYKRENNLEELNAIKTEFLLADKTKLKESLEILCKIHGLGPSGASGLLALLYPTLYGTIDQFVIKSLQQLDDFPELKFINPDNPSVEVVVFIIEKLQKKAEDMNRLFKTNFWTPRKLDKVMWASR